jgi:hypothetical protein
MNDAETTDLLRGVLERHFPNRLYLVEKFASRTTTSEDKGLLRDSVAHALFSEGHWDEKWDPKPSALALEELISKIGLDDCD